MYISLSAKLAAAVARHNVVLYKAALELAATRFSLSAAAHLPVSMTASFLGIVFFLALLQ
jgi:hypothetical protein